MINQTIFYIILGQTFNLSLTVFQLKINNLLKNLLDLIIIINCKLIFKFRATALALTDVYLGVVDPNFYNINVKIYF